jgi:hypothetical protein
MTVARIGKRARPFGLLLTAYDHHQPPSTHINTAHIYVANIHLVRDCLRGLGWFRLPDPGTSPVELEHPSCPRLRFSSALPELAALCPCLFTTQWNIQAPEGRFLRDRPLPPYSRRANGSKFTAAASHSHSALPEESPPPPRPGLQARRSAAAHPAPTAPTHG